jgi:O-antigen ligase
MIVWPFLTLIYAPSIEIRDILLLLYCFLLFLCTIVYTLANGLPAMYRIFSISLVLTIAGLGLSLLKPEYFEHISRIANAKTDHAGRAFGFVLQPNKLGMSLNLLFIGWFCFWKPKHSWLNTMIIPAFLVCVLLTGSRISMIAAILIVACHFIYSWNNYSKKSFFLRTCLTAGCLVAIAVSLHLYLSTKIKKEADLADRMITLLNFKLSLNDSFLEDESFRYRLDAQAVYCSMIKERPLLGFGLGANTYYKDQGLFRFSAHSLAIQRIFEYGIFYPLLFGCLMIQLYKKSNRSNCDTLFRTNSITQFIIFTLFIFMATGGLFDSRLYYIVWGVFFAMAYYPRSLFNYDPVTGEMLSCRTRREIRNESFIVKMKPRK